MKDLLRMFYGYHPVARMPLTSVQVWAGSKLPPRSRGPWISPSRIRFLIILSLTLFAFYYYGPASTVTSSVAKDMPSIEEVQEMKLEEEEVLEAVWRLDRPVNLSLEHTSPDFATTDRITKLVQEDQTIECVHTALVEHMGIHVCIYDDDPEEEAISQQLKTGSFFEHDSVIAMLSHLLEHEELGLVDIGANLGIYSLAAARLGRQVVAVEPLRDNQKRLIKAANINGLQDKVTLIPNAISDTRLNLRLKIPNKNKGRSYQISNKQDCVTNIMYTCSHEVPTMVMDELLPYIPFKEAVLRIDTQGHGMEAIAHSKVFFRQIRVPLICVSWHYYKDKWYLGAKQRAKVSVLITDLVQMNYSPFDVQENELDVSEWRSWPDHVYWISAEKMTKDR